jgi:hypothetical protein
VGKTGDTTVSVEAVISLTETGPKLLKLYKTPLGDMSTRWGWVDVTTSETVLKEATSGQ